MSDVNVPASIGSRVIDVVAQRAEQASEYRIVAPANHFNTGQLDSKTQDTYLQQQCQMHREHYEHVRLQQQLRTHAIGGR